MRRLVISIALLAACGGDDISLDDLIGEARDATCSYYVGCGLIDDLATCRSIYGGELDPSLLAAVDAGKVIYHGDKARECLDAINGSCDRNSLFTNEAQAACDATFEGTVGANGQCALDEECRSRVCNIPDCLEACCQGTCVGDAPVRSGIGGACESSSDCAEGYCDFNMSVCAAYKPLGAACTTSSQCEAGGCVNQVCALLPGPGEACSPTLGNCADIGYTCSTTSMTCVAVGLMGDPCTTARDCSIFYTCTSATCALRPRVGETCDPQATGCIDDSYCDMTTSKCTAPKPDNSPCMDDGECAGSNCDFTTNTCITPPICI